MEVEGSEVVGNTSTSSSSTPTRGTGTETSLGREEEESGEVEAAGDGVVEEAMKSARVRPSRGSVRGVLGSNGVEEEGVETGTALVQSATAVGSASGCTDAPAVQPRQRAEPPHPHHTTTHRRGHQQSSSTGESVIISRLLPGTTRTAESGWLRGCDDSALEEVKAMRGESSRCSQVEAQEGTKRDWRLGSSAYQPPRHSHVQALHPCHPLMSHH